MFNKVLVLIAFFKFKIFLKISTVLERVFFPTKNLKKAVQIQVFYSNHLSIKALKNKNMQYNLIHFLYKRQLNFPEMKVLKVFLTDICLAHWQHNKQKNILKHLELKRVLKNMKY